MRIRTFIGAILTICAFTTLSAQTAQEAREAFLLEHRDSFPQIKMERSPLPNAKIHVLPAGKSALEHQRRYYTGFRFTTPDWLDKDMVWMFATPAPEAALKGIQWFLLPEEPQDGRKISLSSYRYAATDFPGFQTNFPDCDSFIQQRFALNDLRPSQRYIVWFSFPRPDIPELRFALTVPSPRGLFEFGMLPVGAPDRGPGKAYQKVADAPPRPGSESVREAVAVYRQSGIAAGLEKLDCELAAYIDAGGEFSEFYHAVWREGQVGGGRTDVQWAVEVTGWLVDRSLQVGARLPAEKACNNAVSAMLAANRYASATRALEPFLEGMRRRGLPIDPGELADEGPAIASLPEVRLRRYPARARRADFIIEYSGWLKKSNMPPVTFCGSMRDIGDIEFVSGRWKKGLEAYAAVADFADRTRAETFEAESRWYEARMSIAKTLHRLDLLEAADAEYESVLTKGWSDIYKNRNRHAATLRRIAIRIALGAADSSFLPELDELYTTTHNNPFVHRGAWEEVAVTKAECLAALGRTDEAEAILTPLVAENHFARTARIRIRVAAGRLDGLEQELITALRDYREWGRKIDETELYSLYATFLEATGRHAEAIMMRREAVRLMRGFDLFSLLPQELARLSFVLSRTGDQEGAASLAAEARRLTTGDPRIPERISQKVAVILATAPKPSEKDGQKPSPGETELQPERAVVVPIEGMPARGKLTLLNPSAEHIEGSLVFEGLPVSVDADQSAGNIRVAIGSTGQDRVERWILEPGTYTLISIGSAPGAKAEGELRATWTPSKGSARVSHWIFDVAESGVSSAVIDAGEYRLNPFFGVPLHHHYQDRSGRSGAAPFRVTSSVPARIEGYTADDTPLFVDANGNGSLADPGDDLFSDAQGTGQPGIPLEDGEGLVRLQVYPEGPIPAGGLVISLEALVDGKWSVIAENRLLP